MKTSHKKLSSGKVLVKGNKYDQLIGTRAQVWHKTAFKTSGDLTREKLFQNKNGRIVSKKKHATAKKEKRLEKAGYKTRKGHFGYVKDGKTKRVKKGKKSRKSKKR